MNNLHVDEESTRLEGVENEWDDDDYIELSSILPDDALRNVMRFVGWGEFRFVAGTCRQWRRIYAEEYENITSMKSITESASRCHSYLKEKDQKNIARDAHSRPTWLHGTPWAQLCRFAAFYGNLAVLKSLQASDKCTSWEGCQMCAAAAAGGHLDILKWFREQSSNVHWDSSISSSAADRGQLEVLQWLREIHCPWSENTCVGAAANGHLEVLKWLRRNGCCWDSWTCAHAAWNGQLEIIQWARANGCPWDADTCSCAAEKGHLEIIQWAHENGCPWDVWTCTAAAIHGHLEVLRWCVENGCNFDRDILLRCQHLQIKEYIHSAVQNGLE